MDIINLSLKELAKALDEKKVSSTEVTKFYLDRIKKYDGDIKSYLYVAEEQALKDAAHQDALRSKGEAKPGAGIPVGLKDLILTKDMPTTCASKALENFYSPFSATVVDNLKNAGYVMLGKLNMDQFAMGSSGETSYYKKTVNPWNEKKVPGGSSSGSAAAMAARLAPVTLGSDTGGSIRQPAACCGIAGFKPTYGTVSRNGVVGYAGSLDQVGPMTKSVEDTAHIMDVLSMYDPIDSVCVKDINRDFSKNLKADVKGKKIGLPKEYITDDVPEYTKKAVFAAIDTFKSLGAEIVDIAMPHSTFGLPAYQIISYGEVSSSLSRFDGIEFGYRADTTDLVEIYSKSRGESFGDEVKRRVIFGTYVLQAAQYKSMYVQAQKIRRLIRQDYDNAFKQCDLIIGPTSATTAFDMGGSGRTIMEMYLNDLYTVLLNLNGSCGISIPCGFHDGLPIGLQLQGNMFADQQLLNAAYAFECATEWHKKAPAIVG